MSTEAFAYDIAATDTRSETNELSHGDYRQGHYETDRLDPVRLSTATALPLRGCRLLGPDSRKFAHRFEEDATQQVHVLQIDAAITLELDLPAGSRYRLTADAPEAVVVDHQPAASGAIGEVGPSGRLNLVTRTPLELVISVPQEQNTVNGSRAVPAESDEDPAHVPPAVREVLERGRALWSRPVAVIPVARRSSASHVLRVVEQVLAQRPEGVLHPSDLAEPAGISVRSLERTLQRAYGMGPKRWITMTRLNAAHRQLRNPGTHDRTVARVAERHGFLHAGRFSQAYRALFGDYPHEVLGAKK